MELVTGGDLFERIVSIGHYNEVEARTLMQNIFEVIRYLHEKEIVHRDIKPENILLVYKQENTAIKVTDFGLAKSTTDGLNTYCQYLCEGCNENEVAEIQEIFKDFLKSVDRSLDNTAREGFSMVVGKWCRKLANYAIRRGQL